MDEKTKIEDAGIIKSGDETFPVKDMTIAKPEEKINQTNSQEQIRKNQETEIRSKDNPKVKELFDRFYKNRPKSPDIEKYYGNKKRLTKKNIFFGTVLLLTAVIIVSLIWTNISISNGKFQGNTSVSTIVEPAQVNVQLNNTINSGDVLVNNTVYMNNTFVVQISLEDSLIDRIKNMS